MKIGQVSLIEGLYNQKNNKPHIFLDRNKSERVDYLVKDYGKLKKEQLIEATKSIAKKLGREKAFEVTELIQRGSLHRAAGIILSYYDARYHKSISRKKHLIQDHFKVTGDELPELVSQLIKRTTHEV